MTTRVPKSETVHITLSLSLMLSLLEVTEIPRNAQNALVARSAASKGNGDYRRPHWHTHHAMRTLYKRGANTRGNLKSTDKRSNAHTLAQVRQGPDKAVRC